MCAVCSPYQFIWCSVYGQHYYFTESLLTLSQGCTWFSRVDFPHKKKKTPHVLCCLPSRLSLSAAGVSTANQTRYAATVSVLMEQVVLVVAAVMIRIVRCMKLKVVVKRNAWLETDA